jgi:hypothetical protein
MRTGVDIWLGSVFPQPDSATCPERRHAETLGSLLHDRDQLGRELDHRLGRQGLKADAKRRISLEHQPTGGSEPS